MWNDAAVTRSSETQQLRDLARLRRGQLAQGRALRQEQQKPGQAEDERNDHEAATVRT